MVGFTCLHTPAHTHTHIHTPAHIHTVHLLVSSLLFMDSPRAFIFGLPFTARSMSQTVFKASSVHLSFNTKCRFWFCCVGSSILVIAFLSPTLIILLCRSSMIIAFASIASMNRSRKWSRTCSAAWKGKTHGTQTMPTSHAVHCTTTPHACTGFEYDHHCDLSECWSFFKAHGKMKTIYVYVSFYASTRRPLPRQLN